MSIKKIESLADLPDAEKQTMIVTGSNVRGLRAVNYALANIMGGESLLNIQTYFDEYECALKSLIYAVLERHESTENLREQLDKIKRTEVQVLEWAAKAEPEKKEVH